MKIEVKIKEILDLVQYQSKVTGEMKKRQDVIMETIAPYPDEFIATIWNKTADDLGLKEGKTMFVELAFVVDQITNQHDGKVWFKQKVNLWRAE